MDKADKEAKGAKAVAAEIKTRAAENARDAATVQKELTGVEDKVPVWMTLMKYGLWVVILAGIIVLLWQTGLFSAIRVGVSWIAAIMPTPSKEDAKMDLDVLENRMTAEERVAARRSRDRAYDQAFKRMKAANLKKAKEG